jgi:hypothetical protein
VPPVAAVKHTGLEQPHSAKEPVASVSIESEILITVAMDRVVPLAPKFIVFAMKAVPPVSTFGLERLRSVTDDVLLPIWQQSIVRRGHVLG